VAPSFFGVSVWPKNNRNDTEQQATPQFFSVLYSLRRISSAQIESVSDKSPRNGLFRVASGQIKSVSDRLFRFKLACFFSRHFWSILSKPNQIATFQTNPTHAISHRFHLVISDFLMSILAKSIVTARLDSAHFLLRPTFSPISIHIYSASIKSIVTSQTNSSLSRPVHLSQLVSAHLMVN